MSRMPVESVTVGRGSDYIGERIFYYLILYTSIDSLSPKTQVNIHLVLFSQHHRKEQPSMYHIIYMTNRQPTPTPFATQDGHISVSVNSR